MKKKSNYFIYLLVSIILVLIIFFLVKNLTGDKPEGENNQVNSTQLEYLLDRYPIEDVPLYQVNEVSSCKLYNNWDRNNISTFDDEEFTYFNVVFYTEASQSDFLDYYKDLFDEEVLDEYPMPDMVKGYIGRYMVTASHYDSEDTAYIQVYLPDDEVTKKNPYFKTYPDLFEEDSMFVEEENSYGLLNQVGGQTEYTKYFTVIDSGDMDEDGIDDVDEFNVLLSKYVDMYEGKDNYSYDSENSLLSWEEDGYIVRLSIARDHGRVYLNIRGSIE